MTSHAATIGSCASSSIRLPARSEWPHNSRTPSTWPECALHIARLLSAELSRLPIMRRIRTQTKPRPRRAEFRQRTIGTIGHHHQSHHCLARPQIACSRIRRYPFSRTARITRSRVSPVTISGCASARLTVAAETPASRATSAIFAGAAFLPAALAIDRIPCVPRIWRARSARATTPPHDLANGKACASLNEIDYRSQYGH